MMILHCTENSLGGMCERLDCCINFLQLLRGAYFGLVCKCLSVIIITITVFAV